MKNKILLLLSTVLIFASCDEFLNETPRHMWESQTAVSTYEGAEAAVNGIYAVAFYQDYIGTELHMLNTSQSGLMNTNAAAYNFTSQQANSPANPWKTFYQGINAANLAISEIPKVGEGEFPTSTRKEELIAEARFLRGWFHSNIMLTYCYWWSEEESSPYGLLYKGEVTTPDNAYGGRLTVGESWEKIFDDIDYGIEHMSKTFTTPRRVSLIFAKAWKAKLLMIRGEYEDALDLVQDCLDALPAAGIAIQADMAEHFKQSWDSKENILVKYINDDGARVNNAGGYLPMQLITLAGTKCTDSQGNEITQEEADCGLKYGLEWMQADPRWKIVTGKARHYSATDNTYYWTWTKLYRQGKYLAETSAQPDDKFAIYFMRVPELYIMKAECLAHTGASIADAIAPINQMRAQRTNPVLPALEPATEQEMWDAIFQEYVKELILENGCEFWASMRIMKDGVTYMEHMKTTVTSGYEYDPTKLQFAIPNGEVMYNPSLEGMQNPGQE